MPVKTGRFLQQMTSEGAAIVDSQQHKEIVAVDGIVTATGYKSERSLCNRPLRACLPI